MSRLIDADALMETLGITDMDCGKCKWGKYGECKRGADFKDACCAIEDAPTVDAISVVRCKDCRYYIEKEYNYCCAWGDVFHHWEGHDKIDPNGYCYMGERKDE